MVSFSWAVASLAAMTLPTCSRVWPVVIVLVLVLQLRRAEKAGDDRRVALAAEAGHHGLHDPVGRVLEHPRLVGVVEELAVVEALERAETASHVHEAVGAVGHAGGHVGRVRGADVVAVEELAGLGVVQVGVHARQKAALGLLRRRG
jgi:hypothetical protein